MAKQKKRKAKTPKREAPPNVIAYYARISTTDQILDSQHLAIETWIAAQPNQPKVKRYIDEGMSGSWADRPAFNRMLKDCYAGKIATVVVYKLDRLSRHTRTAIMTILKLDECGVGFVAVSQPYLHIGSDAPFGQVLLAVFACLAQLEREAIVERTKAGLAAARRRGVRLGAEKTTTPEIEARAIELRREGKTYRAIGAELALSAATVWKIARAS